MPTTAKSHFDEDIGRSLNLLAHAKGLQDGGDTTQLPPDIRGAAVALAVGALDAYFCDKYVDCLTAALSAYADGTWTGSFPTSYRRKELPAGEVLDASRPQPSKMGDSDGSASDDGEGFYVLAISTGRDF